MTVRLAPGVVDDHAVNVLAFRGLMLAHVPVGRCHCGGSAYGVDVQRAGRRWWCTARCEICGAYAAASSSRVGTARSVVSDPVTA